MLPLDELSTSWLAELRAARKSDATIKVYRDAWHAGLKTTYYLRTLQASNVEKASLQVQKEMRGIVGGPVATCSNTEGVSPLAARYDAAMLDARPTPPPQ